MLSILLHIYTEVELLDQMVISTFNIFEELPYCLPQWLHLLLPPAAYKGFNFLPTFAVFSYFDYNGPNGCEVVVHCGFDFHFPND